MTPFTKTHLFIYKIDKSYYYIEVIRKNTFTTKYALSLIVILFMSLQNGYNLSWLDGASEYPFSNSQEIF